MIDERDKEQIKRMISLELHQSYRKKVGDTPTDALQLVPKKYVDSLITPGSFASDGTASAYFPSSWAVAKTSTGTYEVTHNFGTTAYSVVANSASTTTAIIMIESRGANSFVLTAREPLGNTLVDTAISFMVSKPY